MQTAISRLLCALVFVHATGRMASAKDVLITSGAATTGPRVDIVFDGPLASRRLEVLALKEAALIWAAHGVDVGAAKADDRESINAVSLTVTFGNTPGRGMAAASLGSIQFVNGVPEPAIVLYPNAIGALVSAMPSATFFVNSPGAIRDFILGRVLGRALAHEIGHFLLRSLHHSTVGLMRAFQPTADLVDPDRRHFGLSDGDVTRLVAMTSLFPRPSGLLCGD